MTETIPQTSVAKRSCDCWLIHRSEDGRFRDWVVICLTEGGTLLINSDYGSWAYHWSHPGMPIREFLCKIDHDYLLRKLLHDRPKHFNCGKTVEQIKRWIDEMLQEGRRAYHRGEEVRFTEDMAEDARELLEVIGDECHASADMFAHRCIDSDELGWLYQRATDGICVMEHDPQCVAFVERLWPVFTAELKREMLAS